MDKIKNICTFLGKRVREERIKLKLTQEKLSEQMDVTTEFISRIERGIGIPSFETFIKLAKVLNVSLDSLVADNETESVNKQISYLFLGLNKKQRKAAINIMAGVVKEVKENIK